MGQTELCVRPRLRETHSFPLPNLILRDQKHFFLHVRDSDQARRAEVWAHDRKEHALFDAEALVLALEHVSVQVELQAVPSKWRSRVCPHCLCERVGGWRARYAVAIRHMLQRRQQAPKGVFKLKFTSSLPVNDCERAIVVPEQGVDLAAANQTEMCETELCAVRCVLQRPYKIAPRTRGRER